MIGKFEHDSVTILAADEEGCRLLGYAAHDLIGQPLVSFIDNPDFAGLAKLRMSLLRRKGSIAKSGLPTIEYPVRRKNGSIFIGKVTTTVIKENRFQTTVHWIREANADGR
jgi:PAS domain S-box-containing protein